MGQLSVFNFNVYIFSNSFQVHLFAREENTEDKDAFFLHVRNVNIETVNSLLYVLQKQLYRSIYKKSPGGVLQNSCSAITLKNNKIIVFP